MHLLPTLRIVGLRSGAALAAVVPCGHRNRAAAFWLCLLCWSVWIAPANATAADDAVHWASQDPEKIVAQLEQIRDVYRDAVTILDNIEIFAQCEPGDRSAHLVIKNGKRRFDTEVVDPKGARGTIYHLFDGDNYYVLNPSQLGIFADHDLEKKWRGTASAFYSYQMPTFGGRLVPVDEFCESLIAILKGDEAAQRKARFEKGGPDFSLRVDGMEVVLESRTSPEWQTKGGSSFSVTLDSSRHYVMTALHEEERRAADDPKSWQYVNDVRAEYREIAPGVYYLSSGTRVIKDLGEVARRDNRERTENHSITVTRVAFGDFDVSPQTFSRHELPITPGLSVHDARTNPEVDFVYKSGPFDEEILERALRDAPTPVPPRSFPAVLLALNVIALVAVSVWLVLRRRATLSTVDRIGPQ